MKVSSPRFDAAAVRADLPMLRRSEGGKSLVYLDSACTAPKPEPVLRAVHEFYLEHGGCGGRRSSHPLSQEVQRRADRARQSVARHLGAASPNEIVFTSSTTDSMNLLARAFPFERSRDEVLVTDLTHNSAFLPFLERSREGVCRLRVLPTREGRLEPGELERSLSERTALVVLTRASNVFGGTQPVAALARLAHRHGAKVAVDAAQFLPTHREDVQASDSDFLAFSAHKLGGPFGVGVLYGKERLLNGLRPARPGGGAVREVFPSGGGWEAAYLDAPERFEAGVQNVAGWAGLEAALDYLSEPRLAGGREHVASLVTLASERLRGVAGLRVLGEPERLREGSLVSVVPEDPDFPFQDLSLYLAHELPDRTIALRVGEHCAHLFHRGRRYPGSIRLSFWLHNTEEEAEAAVDAVARFLELQR